MQVRAYEQHDLEALQRIHAAQGFEYAFPDLQNPLFLTKLVLVGDTRSREEGPVNESCQVGAQQCCAPTSKIAPLGIVGAALLRLTAEAYLLLDPNVGTPRERWEWLLGLHTATEHEAARRGLEDVHAWLPPEIAAKFGKRLSKLGWIRDDVWTPFCRRLK
jgi:hypothetical protein